ncbi:uncharacterized protein LOC112089267 [Eutrema salsugineum]|uniref:uncharacterized protein LOC112089267 n=1 Tax=Eutrema salsugineum TaxID=72664 RepID=UPI000CED4F6E|nr:uncharacterized protein LOC112089267 [Eutrema salsugineum]
MGDIVLITKPNKSNPSTIQYLILNATNYTVWRTQMKVALKVRKVWEAIDPGTTEGDKDNLARALLFQSIPKALILQVGNLDTSKAVWEAIKTVNMGADRVKEVRLQTLMADFDRIKMKETYTTDDFVGKLSELSTKSAALGETIKESKLIHKNLMELVEEDDGVDASMDEEEVVGTTTAMITNKTEAIDRRKTDRIRKLQEAQENEEDKTQEAEELMMHEVVYLNEKNVKPDKFETCSDGDNVWYLDNGASNHMTGNWEYFSKLKENITGEVRFGDNSRIDIKGKGFILFVSKNGDRKVLADVYFISDLKSNIISLGQATKLGYDIRMKGDHLTHTIVMKRRQVFPQATAYRAAKLLDLIHGDLCGPITPPTAERNIYIFVLIDDHSRYMWSILLKEKSEAFDKLKKFKATVEQETSATIKTF